VSPKSEKDEDEFDLKAPKIHCEIARPSPGGILHGCSGVTSYREKLCSSTAWLEALADNLTLS